MQSGEIFIKPKANQRTRTDTVDGQDIETYTVIKAVRVEPENQKDFLKTSAVLDVTVWSACAMASKQKYAFGRKLLGFVVSQRGFEVDPEKVKAILDFEMPPPMLPLNF